MGWAAATSLSVPNQYASNVFSEKQLCYEIDINEISKGIVEYCAILYEMAHL